MFDANLRGLPRGKEFFAKIHHINANNPLHNVGYKRGDILLCCMFGEDEDGCVHISVKKRSNETYLLSCGMGDDLDYFTSAFIVYEGNLDLTGFIYEESKAKAKKLLEVISL